MQSVTTLNTRASVLYWLHDYEWKQEQTPFNITGESELNCIYGMTAMQSESRFLCRLHNGENTT